MNTGQFIRRLRPAAFLLLLAAVFPVFATAIYSASVTSDLTIDTLTGEALITPLNSTPGTTSYFVDPTGAGTATATASSTLLAPNTLSLQATTDGTASPTSDPIFGLGTTSFATGSVTGGFQVQNTGSDPLTLLVYADSIVEWTLLVDNPINESATAALSLDLYVDGSFVQSLVNWVDLQANGSDTQYPGFQLDINDPLATLDAGQSRIFELVASATANATAIPEPGTLFLTLIGLVGVGHTLRRRT